MESDEKLEVKTNPIYSSEGDLALWRDLLRRARGDAQLATKWMNEIGVGSPSANNPGLQQDFDLAAAEAGAPATFYCPISFRVLRDPVMLSTGQTYERQYLEKWLAFGNTTCPATGQRLPAPVQLTANVAMRKSIEEWCQTHVPWILDREGRLKPIRLEESDHFSKALAANGGCSGPAAAPGGGPPAGDDLRLAISLQEAELDRFSGHSRRQRAQQQRAARLRRRGAAACSLLNLLLLAASLGCTAVFLLALGKAGWQIERLSVNPLVGPPAAALAAAGSRVSASFVGGKQWWRLATSLFVSSGVIHLFAAVTGLWTLGKYLETCGSLARPLLAVPAIYFVSAAAGCLASASLAFDADSSGACAGVCGLLGAVWAEQACNLRKYRSHLATALVLGLLTAMLAVISLLPLVGMWFQAVAFLAGVLLLPVFLRPPQPQEGRARACVWLLKLACLALVAGGIGVALASLLADNASLARQCGWCSAANCVGTRWWDCEPAAPFAPQPACTFAANANSTTSITCPSGAVRLVRSDATADAVAACNRACSTLAVFAAPPPVSVGGAGVLI